MLFDQFFNLFFGLMMNRTSGSKSFKKGAVSQSEFVEAMGLLHVHETPDEDQITSTIGGKPLKVSMCSLYKKIRLKEGFNWLEKHI